MFCCCPLIRIWMHNTILAGTIVVHTFATHPCFAPTLSGCYSYRRTADSDMTRLNFEVFSSSNMCVEVDSSLLGIPGDSRSRGRPAELPGSGFREICLERSFPHKSHWERNCLWVKRKGSNFGEKKISVCKILMFSCMEDPSSWVASSRRHVCRHNTKKHKFKVRK